MLDVVGGAVHRVGFEIPPFGPLAESGTESPAELPGSRQCSTHSYLKSRWVEFNELRHSNWGESVWADLKCAHNSWSLLTTESHLKC